MQALAASFACSSAACSSSMRPGSSRSPPAQRHSLAGRGLLQHLVRSSSRQLAPAPRAFQFTGRKWWEETRNVPGNVRHVHSVQELVNALGEAGDRLVIVDFFAPWCAACKSLYPKLCKLVAAHPDVTLLCCNFDDNKSLVKSLNVKVLPFLQFYRGAHGKVAQFSVGASKIKLVEDAIARYSGPVCLLAEAEQLPALTEFPNVVPKPRKGEAAAASAAPAPTPEPTPA